MNLWTWYCEKHSDKEANQGEFYQDDVVCLNCNKKQRAKIPKGVKVSDFIVTALCPNCGCKSIAQSW